MSCIEVFHFFYGTGNIGRRTFLLFTLLWIAAPAGCIGDDDDDDGDDD